MDKALVIQNICSLLLENKRQDCVDLANEHYPFINNSSQKRSYTTYQKCKIFLRDGFIDRYSGDKLLFPGLIMVLSLEFPEIFKYQTNWKMSETHMIYWDLVPTVDHLVPVARGGQDNDSNWITTSMIHNSAKANFTIEELGWKLHDKGNLNDWDGLVKYFIELTKANPAYADDKYIKDWKTALQKAMN